MSALTCPGCGAVYSMASVGNLGRFQCSMCHQVIVVPVAGPSASRAAPPVPPAPRPAARAASPSHAPSAAPTRHHRAPHGRAERVPSARGPNWPLFGALAAVAACGVVAAIALSRPSPGEASPGPAPAPAPAPAATPAPAPPPRPKGDPAKDPAAWKALSAAEREDRRLKYLAALDRRDGEILSRAFTFLNDRDEADAARRVAEWEFARDPGSSWARKARGDVMVGEKAERVLAECPRAEEVESGGVQKLKRLRKQHAPATGLWWADAALARELDAVFAEIRADEKALAAPYARACAKWALYQRRIEVMREHAAITGTAGPYLLFVQVKAPPGTPLEGVAETEVTRARRVLERNQELFAAFYEGFHECLGAALGVARHEASSIDEKTLLKANIFADESTWDLYHKRMGFDRWVRDVRAYYQVDEPRFIVSYDPGEAESSETDEVHCFAATAQLLHFYTWDVTRKAEGTEPAWPHCAARPPWLDVGFCEHFSSHRRDGAKLLWMQPDEARMRELWVFDQVLARKRWAMWTLDEMLSITRRQQIDEQAERRVFPRPVKDPTEEQLQQAGLAVTVMGPVFFAKSWSLVHFLWNQTDAAGRPAYRDRFVAFLKSTLRVRREEVPNRGPQAVIAGASDFRRAMGLEPEASYRAFEKEWLAWEKAYVAAAQKADWPQKRDGWLRRLGIK